MDAGSGREVGFERIVLRRKTRIDVSFHALFQKHFSVIDSVSSLPNRSLSLKINSFAKWIRSSGIQPSRSFLPTSLTSVILPFSAPTASFS